MAARCESRTLRCDGRPRRFAGQRTAKSPFDQEALVLRPVLVHGAVPALLGGVRLRNATFVRK